jgi:hypothetical protein
MKKAFVLLLASAAIIGGAIALGNHGGAQAASGMAPVSSPANGFTLHIDAIRHFPAHPDEVAHHWCKGVAGITECQIYDSDGPQAHLIAIETVVPTAVWKTFPASEQKLWHYHRVEIQKIDAKLPGMSSAYAARVIYRRKTYGKSIRSGTR